MDGGRQVLDRTERWKMRERLRGPAFPSVIGEWPAPTRTVVLEPVCETLAAGTATVHGRFGFSLRGDIAFHYPRLHRICGDDAPTWQETVRLVASFNEAIEKIEAWAERHGLDALDTDAEDAGARCGWPDENGNGWNPHPCNTMGHPAHAKTDLVGNR